MPQSEEKIPRITAGPIEDLGVVVDKLVKLGFVQIVSVVPEPKRCTLHIDTLFGSETADVPLEDASLSISAMQLYLSEKKMYLARASLAGEGQEASITGDLYREK